jgi:hypothetical protein
MRRWAYDVLRSHAKEVKLREDWIAVKPGFGGPRPWVTPEILVAEGILLLTSEKTECELGPYELTCQCAAHKLEVK